MSEPSIAAGMDAAAKAVANAEALVDNQAQSDQWNCSVLSENKNLPLKLYGNHEDTEEMPDIKGLTVGSVFQLKCQGPSLHLDKEKITLTPQPADKFKIKLLSVDQMADDQFVLTVTSLAAGEHELSNVILSDGLNKVSLHGIKVKVEALVDSEAANPPFGSFGSMQMSLPFYYWLSLFVMVILVSGLAVWRIKKWLLRRKTIKGLSQYDTPLSPINQFYKDLRLLDQNRLRQKVTVENFLLGLEDTVRLYLIRELRIPVMNLDEKQITKELKKWRSQLLHLKERKKMSEEGVNQVRLFFSEVAKVKQGEALDQDIKQLIDLSRKTVEIIGASKKRG